MAKRDESCLRRDPLLQVIEPQAALVIDLNDAHRDAGLRCRASPRQQVGVVFREGEEHLVARTEIGSSPRAGNQVDPLGRASSEDDFVGALCYWNRA